MKRLSENLKLIRKQSWGMSQDKFAELLNSSRSKISSYENGGIEPSIEFMIQLQNYTNISIKDLFSSQLILENIPASPIFETKKEIVKIEEEEPSYEPIDKDLQRYGLTISNRLQEIEQRLEELERKDKNRD